MVCEGCDDKGVSALVPTKRKAVPRLGRSLRVRGCIAS